MVHQSVAINLSRSSSTVEKLKRLSRFQSTADLATVPALDQMERNFYGVVRERRVLALCRGSALY